MSRALPPGGRTPVPVHRAGLPAVMLGVAGSYLGGVLCAALALTVLPGPALHPLSSRLHMPRPATAALDFLAAAVTHALRGGAGAALLQALAREHRGYRQQPLHKQQALGSTGWRAS